MDIFTIIENNCLDHGRRFLSVREPQKWHQLMSEEELNLTQRKFDSKDGRSKSCLHCLQIFLPSKNIFACQFVCRWKTSPILEFVCLQTSLSLSGVGRETSARKGDSFCLFRETYLQAMVFFVGVSVPFSWSYCLIFSCRPLNTTRKIEVDSFFAPRQDLNWTDLEETGWCSWRIWRRNDWTKNLQPYKYPLHTSFVLNISKMFSKG